MRLAGSSDWPYRQLSSLDRHIARWTAELDCQDSAKGGIPPDSFDPSQRSDTERAVALARHTKVRRARCNMRNLLEIPSDIPVVDRPSWGLHTPFTSATAAS